MWIRRGGKAQFEELAAIWEASVLATHGFLRDADFAALKSEVPEIYLPSLEELWLCGIRGKLAGFLGCDGPCVEMLFVAPEFFRMGVGRKLLAHARELHGPLSVSVNRDNRGALQFYLRNGFSLIGASPLDGQGRPYPVLHLAQQRETEGSG